MKNIIHCLCVILLLAGSCSLLRADEASPGGLDGNYTLTVKGYHEDTTPLDLVLITGGSKLSVNLVDPPRRVEAVIKSLPDGRFSIDYVIGGPLPISSGGPITYRESQVVGTVVLKLGKPVPIIKVGAKTLTLTLAKYEDS